jgi:hypothetical protein
LAQILGQPGGLQVRARWRAWPAPCTRTSSSWPRGAASPTPTARPPRYWPRVLPRPSGPVLTKHSPECEQHQIGREVAPTSAFYGCMPTGMHGPTCIFWANLALFSLCGRHGAGWQQPGLNMPPSRQGIPDRRATRRPGRAPGLGRPRAGAAARRGTGARRGARCEHGRAPSEKGVRLAQKMPVCPCIHVGIQLEKAEVGPTSGPTWRLSHSA